jgi:hypothetical protein
MSGHVVPDDDEGLYQHAERDGALHRQAATTKMFLCESFWLPLATFNEPS